MPFNISDELMQRMLNLIVKCPFNEVLPVLEQLKQETEVSVSSVQTPQAQTLSPESTNGSATQDSQ